MEEEDDESYAAARREAIANAMQKRRDDALEEKGRREQSVSVLNVLNDIDQVESGIRDELCSVQDSKLSGVALSSLFDEIARKLQRFEKSLSEYSRALPQYELRRAQNSAAEMQTKFQQIQAELQPKKKFGFKGTKSKVGAKEEEICKQSPVIISLKREEIGYIIEDKADEVIAIGREEIARKDVLLNNLQRCKIRIQGNPSTLHMTGLMDCVVLAGPVSTSIFLDNCHRCSFVLACQQLRTHRTKDSDFYLHVTSRAIIEDSSAVRFAPYVITYENVDEDFETSGLSRSNNNWDDVDDFNWLASDQPSPNWAILSEKDRKMFTQDD